MKISELILGIKYIKCNVNGESEFNGICIDSRTLEKGDVFIALKGENVDSHRYVPEVLEKGAVAVVVNTSFMDCASKDIYDRIIAVKDTNKILGILASKFYNNPTGKLNVIGVTGTNGKTTVTHLISKLLQKNHDKVGILSTTGYIYEGESQTAINTTPNPLEIQKFAKKIAEAKGNYLVMEASSHGIVTNRLNGTEFDIAVFTNITQDHLDFHKTFENYLLAKGLFLTSMGTGGIKNGNSKYVVINGDDPYYRYFNSVTLCNTLTYGIDQYCDVRAEDLQIGMTGSKFMLKTWLGDIDIEIKMIGKFSIYNSLAAISVALLEGMTLANIKEAFQDIQGVPGRFETIRNKEKGYTVVVDYAHTPDGLKNVLKTSYDLKKNKIILVFGCGGNRDKGKRPLMANIAERYADYSIVTNDNPRLEDPKAIVEDILTGFDENNYEVIFDRKEAIKKAVNMAQKDDIILIVGKGHENYQIIGENTIDFDDKVIAETIMKGNDS